MPGGRPTGSKNKTTKEKPQYTCMCCLEEKVETDFYKSPYTRMWNFSNKRVLFCKSCIDELMKEYSVRYGELNALAICCALLDIPFYASAYRAIIEKNPVFNIGMYTRLLNGSQYKQKCFINTLIEGELGKAEEVVKDECIVDWTDKDKQNKKYALSVVGYDPFDDETLTDSDKKHCYNILASYCDTDGIREDGHKIQSVIELTQLQLQCKKLNELFNSELIESSPDDSKIKTFSEAKSRLLTSISKIAQDNNITSSSNGTAKQGKSTLSYKMKEMAENGFEDIKVNLFDINTSGAMKQVADLSNQSIIEQLTWDDNDYTQMIKEQREMITSQRTKLDEVIEENRLLKNQVSLINATKK